MSLSSCSLPVSCLRRLALSLEKARCHQAHCCSYSHLCEGAEKQTQIQRIAVAFEAGRTALAGALLQARGIQAYSFTI